MRALLLQVFYSVRSERMLCEQMKYNLLLRWFVGIPIDQTVWDHSVFSKNRDRLFEHEVIEAFFTEVMTLADKRNLLSKEHFSVDGTLIQAWASQKSFRPSVEPDDPAPGSGRNAQADWKGKPRSNDTHACRTASGCAPVPQEQQHRRHPVLSGTCVDGEPQRTDGESGGHSR